MEKQLETKNARRIAATIYLSLSLLLLVAYAAFMLLPLSFKSAAGSLRTYSGEMRIRAFDPESGTFLPEESFATGKTYRHEYSVNGVPYVSCLVSVMLIRDEPAFADGPVEVFYFPPVPAFSTLMRFDLWGFIGNALVAAIPLALFGAWAFIEKRAGILGALKNAFGKIGKPWKRGP